MSHLLTCERPSKASEPFLKTPAFCCISGCTCTKVEAGWLLEQSTQELIMAWPGSNSEGDWQLGSGCTLKGRTSKMWQIMNCEGTSQEDSSVLELRNFTNGDHISQALESVNRTCLRHGKQEKTKLLFGHFLCHTLQIFLMGVFKCAIRPTGRFSQKQHELKIKLGCGLYVVSKNLNMFSVAPLYIGRETVPEYLE